MSFISMIGGGKVEDILATSDWFVDQHIKGRLWRIGQANYQNNTPTQIGAGSDWSRLMVGQGQGSDANFVLTRDNTAYAWGNNSQGQLGLGDTTTRSSPTQLGTAKNWRLLAANSWNGAGIRNDGTLWTWGDGYYGNLLDTKTNRLSPAQVGSATNWRFVAFPNYQCMVLSNTSGNLYIQNSLYSGYGGSNLAQLSLAVEAGPWGRMRHLAVSNAALLIIGEDGKMWVLNGPNFRWIHQSWITNVYSSEGQRESPLQFLYGAESRSWKSATIGGYRWGSTNYISILAIADDGTLWAWGYNANGRLGLGDTTDRSTFTQVGTSSDWKQVLSSDGTGNAMAVKYDGTLWAWGRNDGSLGTGDQTEKTVPTRVGTANYWKEISCIGGDYLGITYY